MLVAGAGGVFTLGTGLWSVGAFVVPMEAELEWNRTTLLGGLTGFLGVYLSWFVDVSSGATVVLVQAALTEPDL